MFKGKLSIPILEDAYMSLVYGNTEPDIIRVNQVMADKIKSALYAANSNRHHHSGIYKYNLAEIMTDNTVKDNQIIIGFKSIPTHFKSIPGAIPCSIIDIED